MNTQPPKASAVLQQRASRDRAELRAEKAQVRASEARVEYAGREYYPDFTVMASYNSMWDSIEHQLMVGIAAPLPIQRGRRRGAVDEANAIAAEARHEQRARIIEIRREVEVARTRVIEAIQVVRLYEDELLPLVRDRLRAAQAGFEADANDFAAVIAAEDDLREAELKYYAAQTQLSQRRAELERATGQLPGIAAGQRTRTRATRAP